MRLEEFDQAYVDALRARNPETERHFAAYFERCLRGKLRGLSKEDAEDVRQETLTRVLAIVHSAQGVRTPGALGALVASTCHYALLEHLRKRRSHVSLEETADPAGDADSERELLTSESRAAVHAVLAGMNERDRRLLRAVFVEEKERAAICEELGASRDGLRVLLHRAKLAFKKQYERREGTA